ncbi:MAG: hypothetical protein AAFY85_04940, partial [Pseudomonadota bacterium]
FSSDGELRDIPDSSIRFGLLDMRNYGKQHHDFHAIICDSMLRDGLTVAIGDGGAPVGVAQIQSSDEKWRKDALILMKGATEIFIIPSANDGTFEEIEMITENSLLSKTIFISPPSHRDYNAELEWRNACARCVQLDLHLPDYDQIRFKWGCLVRLSPATSEKIENTRFTRNDNGDIGRAVEYRKVRLQGRANSALFEFRAAELPKNTSNSDAVRESYLKLVRPGPKKVSQ